MRWLARLAPSLLLVLLIHPLHGCGTSSSKASVADASLDASGLQCIQPLDAYCATAAATPAKGSCLDRASAQSLACAPQDPNAPWILYRCAGYDLLHVVDGGEMQAWNYFYDSTSGQLVAVTYSMGGCVYDCYAGAPPLPADGGCSIMDGCQRIACPEGGTGADAAGD